MEHDLFHLHRERGVKNISGRFCLVSSTQKWLDYRASCADSRWPSGKRMTRVRFLFRFFFYHYYSLAISPHILPLCRRLLCRCAAVVCRIQQCRRLPHAASAASALPRLAPLPPCQPRVHQGSRASSLEVLAGEEISSSRKKAQIIELIQHTICTILNMFCSQC